MKLIGKTKLMARCPGILQYVSFSNAKKELIDRRREEETERKRENIKDGKRRE